MANDESTPTPDSIEVQMSFRVPGRMPGVYAHHLFVQPGPHEVILSFLEVIPPIMAPGQSPEENLKQLQETGVVSECVARVIVPNARFSSFAKIIEEMAARMAGAPAESQPDNPNEAK